MSFPVEVSGKIKNKIPFIILANTFDSKYLAYCVGVNEMYVSHTD